MSPFWGEFIGTMLLIILGNGVVGGVVLNKSKAQGAGWVVITFGWGIAVTMAIYAVGNISGAHINPAVTLALASAGSFDWEKVPTYLTGQMLGAFVGAAIVWLHYLPHWKQTESPEEKLAVFCTAPAIRLKWANLLSEIGGTFVLVVGLMFIGANDFTEGLNPIVVGILIVSIGMSLGGTTGYAINPARDLGPRIAHALLPVHGKGKSDWGYATIPVIGPIIGGIFGAVGYEATFNSSIGLPFWISLTIVIIVAGLAINESLGKNQV